MTCNEVRATLMAAPGAAAVGFDGAPASPTGAAGLDPILAAHLGRCPGCTDFARRLAAIRAALAAEHLDVAPDPGFAARVVAALPDDTQLLGWAALRLLPAALALLAGLAWVGLGQTPSPSQALLGDLPGDTLFYYSAVVPGAGP